MFLMWTLEPFVVAKMKSASLVFSYYGDSKFNSFFQEAQNIGKSMEGYNYNVLLKHENKEVGIDLNEKDEKRCDVKEAPTKDNFEKYMLQLARDGYMIDVWIFSHGSRNGFKVSKGKYGQDDFLTEEQINTRLAPSKAGLKQLPIRLVYQVNCWGKNLNNTWSTLGAKVSVGARFVNFYPNQYGKFVNNWNDGVRIKKALNEADTATSRTVVQTYIIADAVYKHKVKGSWDGCPTLKTVLGDDDCAKDYFTKFWLDKDEWQRGKSGKDNMNYSSQMCINGNDGIQKNDVPTWN